MNVIGGKDFEDEDVILDFNEYRSCKFTRCRLVYHGFGETQFTDVETEDCSYILRGPARSFVEFMGGLWERGERTVVLHFVQAMTDGFESLRVLEVGDERRLILDLGPYAGSTGDLIYGEPPEENEGEEDSS